jgi:hypothetical protein
MKFWASTKSRTLLPQKLDELNKALTAAESERMDKESVYRLVQVGDADTIASAAGALDSLVPGTNRLRDCWKVFAPRKPI